MRVIAGKARRLPLKTVPGMDTRPTTDRIKETLFNILQNDLYGIRFLDIFSGSGGIGIEALSRGAAEAYFIENARAAVACIRDNLEFTHLMESAKIFPCDVMTALSRLEGEKPFQIIFMDPPYGQGLEQRVLEYMADTQPSYVDQETLIIIEAALETDFSYVGSLGFSLERVKEYKTNKHVFIRRSYEDSCVSGQL